LEDDCQDLYAAYEGDIEAGVSRELARVRLPVNLYTEWYWKVDLHNLLHFLGLRQDKHAQKEIRDYADAMYELISPLVPIAVEAYNHYHPNRGGMLLSEMDVRYMAGDDNAWYEFSKRERKELAVKAERLSYRLRHNPNE
jgi:thymidylate synthase (FAD)